MTLRVYPDFLFLFVQKKSESLTPEKARLKIFRYCSYQERSHQEVRQKLYHFGLRENEVDSIVTDLMTAGFLNEERFARAFAGGKFRMKKWGRLKIQNELEFRGLTRNCIKSGMQEIDERDYRKSLEQLLTKKAGALVKLEDSFMKRDRLANYAINKGFEPELVWETIKALDL